MSDLDASLRYLIHTIASSVDLWLQAIQDAEELKPTYATIIHELFHSSTLLKEEQLEVLELVKAMVQDRDELSEVNMRRAADTEAYTLASLMLLLSDGEGESR